MGQKISNEITNKEEIEENENKQNSFGDLNIHLCILISSFLDLKSLSRVERLNKQWKRALEDKKVNPFLLN